MQTLPNDTMYNIMLNASVDDISSLCFNNNYCDDLFWEQKFKHDNLPLRIKKQMTLNKWITLYKKSKQAYDDANIILNKITKTINIELSNSYMRHFQLSFLPSDLFKNISVNAEPYLLNITVKDNLYKLKFIALYKNALHSTSVTIDREALHDVLFHFLFDNKVTINYI